MSRTAFFVVLAAGSSAGLLIPSQRAAPPPANIAHAVSQSSPEKPGRAVLETVIPRNANGHFYVDAKVNGQFIHFLIDTGATGVALTESDARLAGISFSRDKFEVVGRGVSGDVMGQRVNINQLSLDQKEAFDMPAVVMGEGLDVSLLGQSFLSRIGKVEISNDKMILG